MTPFHLFLKTLITTTFYKNRHPGVLLGELQISACKPQSGKDAQECPLFEWLESARWDLTKCLVENIHPANNEQD